MDLILGELHSDSVGLNTRDGKYGADDEHGKSCNVPHKNATEAALTRFTIQSTPTYLNSLTKKYEVKVIMLKIIYTSESNLFKTIIASCEKVLFYE